MNVVDYFIIAFVFLGTVKGYRRGLMAGLVCFLSWVAAGLGAYFFCPFAVSWLDKQLDLTNSLAEILRNRLPVEAMTTEGLFKPLFVPGLDFGNLTRYVQDVWAASPGNAGGLADALSQQAASLLAHGFVFALLVAVFFIFLRFLTQLLSRRLSRTVLGFFNRLGGMVFGTGVNLLGAGLVVGLLTPWLVMGTWESGGLLHSAAGYFAQSTIAPYFSFLFIWVSAALAGMPL